MLMVVITICICQRPNVSSISRVSKRGWRKRRWLTAVNSKHTSQLGTKSMLVESTRTCRLLHRVCRSGCSIYRRQANGDWRARRHSVTHQAAEIVSQAASCPPADVDHYVPAIRRPAPASIDVDEKLNSAAATTTSTTTLNSSTSEDLQRRSDARSDAVFFLVSCRILNSFRSTNCAGWSRHSNRAINPAAGNMTTSLLAAHSI